MHDPAARRDDDGFTLIEVIIAVALLLGVAVALGAFAIQGLRLAADQQRAQLAVSVASARMDEVQRLTGSNAQLETLISGRRAAPVTAAFAATAGVSGVAATYPASTTSGATAVIPITQTVRRSGTDFRSTVLLGTCYQPTAAGQCGKISGKPADPFPAATPDLSRMIRVIVIVDYTGSCGGSDSCTFTTSALFDTKGDVPWLAY
ncbi:type IV pilus modification PilV family protein [Microbacterium sp. NPDC055521]